MPQYDAFISYSHKADGLTAPTLQKGLENFNRGWLRPRPLRIFRDETDLSLAPSLSGVIQEALDASRFFILLASPAAANSKWVDQEVSRWLDTKPAGNILLVITDGGYAWNDSQHDFDRSASTAIPPALFGRFSDEPLFLDLRGIELKKHRRAEAQTAIASLAAPIHGKSKQELLGLEIQLFRRRLFIAGLAVVSIALLAVGFLWKAVDASKQRDAARLERNHAQSQLAAARSTLDLQNRLAKSAFWNAARAWKMDPDWVAQKALYDFARTGLQATLDHGAAVWDAAISRNGRYALTSGVGGLKVWNTNGSPAFSEAFTSGEAANFSPDGSAVAVGELGGRLSVFTIAGLKQFEFSNKATIEYTGFSADSRYLFTAAMGTPIRRFNRAGQMLNEYRYQGTVSCVAPSADGSMIAAGTVQGDVYLWNIDGKLFRVFRRAGLVSSVEFSRDNSRLFSVTPQGILSMNPADGATRILLDHEPFAAAVSSDVDQIAVLDEQSVQLLDFDGRVLRTLKDESKSEGEPAAEPRQPTRSREFDAYHEIGRWSRGHIAYLSDGRYIAASLAGATRVWDLATGRSANILNGSLTAASPNDKYLVTSGKHAALVWAADDAFRSEVRQPSGISAAAFAPSDGTLATASFDGIARIWSSQEKITAAFAHGAPLTSVAFSHNGEQLLTVGRDSAVRLWSRSGTPLAQFGHADIVNQAAFAPDDRQIATASADGTAAIWTPQGKRIATFDHKSEVYYAVYSPDGESLATSAADHTLRLWSTRSDLARWQYAGPETITKIAFSSDGRRIVATTTENEVLIVEADTGRLLAELKHPDEVIDAEVAPSAELVITSAADRIVRIWKMDGRLVRKLPHPGSVGSVQVSRDGMRVLTGSRDGSARLWDLSGNELLTFLDSDNIQQAVFSADDETVVTVSPHRVRVWNFGSPASIIAYFEHSIEKPAAEEAAPDR
jgi:WD40 repeat protein